MLYSTVKPYLMFVWLSWEWNKPHLVENIHPSLETRDIWKRMLTEQNAVKAQSLSRESIISAYSVQ